LDKILSLFNTFLSLSLSLSLSYSLLTFHLHISCLVIAVDALPKISHRILSCISGPSTHDHFQGQAIQNSYSVPTTPGENDQIDSSGKFQAFIRKARSSNLPRADRIS
jgi:hypothetical protein